MGRAPTDRLIITTDSEGGNERETLLEITQFEEARGVRVCAQRGGFSLSFDP
jgi:hypothetical protein